MRSWILALGALLMLGACGGAKSVQAPNDVVAKAAYRHDGPARLTLFTVISNESGRGQHTSLMINGSQRVIFDPAGSFEHPRVAEQNDVVFGITPQVADGYTRYHARKSFHVQVQQVDVTPELAEMAIRAVRVHGASPSGRCSRDTSNVISGLPGFEHIQQTWFPGQLAKQFAKIPGVTSTTLYEYDSDDNSKVLAAWDPTAFVPKQSLSPE